MPTINPRWSPGRARWPWRSKQQGGTPDTVLVSVGGGGLIAGIASWFAERARVVALEPELAPTLCAARRSGEPVDVPVSGIAADSLGAKRIGAIAWEVTQRHVKDAMVLPGRSHPRRAIVAVASR